MTIKRSMYDSSKDYDCLDTDLTAGVPPLANPAGGNFIAGDEMMVYNDTSKALENVFVLKDIGNGLEWMKLL